jgi:hypothetical protein
MWGHDPTVASVSLGDERDFDLISNPSPTVFQTKLRYLLVRACQAHPARLAFHWSSFAPDARGSPYARTVCGPNLDAPNAAAKCITARDARLDPEQLEERHLP